MELEIGLTILRVSIGLVLAAHGSQKVLGWFGGHGLDGTKSMHESLGMRPAGLWAWVNGGVELAGGLFFAFGILTPLMAAAIVINMLMAVFLVHRENGFFNMNSGYEFPLTLAVGALTFGLTGPGAYALGPQSLAGIEPMGLFIAAALAGLLLMTIVLATRRTTPSREPQPGD